MTVRWLLEVEFKGANALGYFVLGAAQAQVVLESCDKQMDTLEDMCKDHTVSLAKIAMLQQHKISLCLDADGRNYFRTGLPSLEELRSEDVEWVLKRFNQYLKTGQSSGRGERFMDWLTAAEAYRVMKTANEMVLRGRRRNTLTSRFGDVVDARFESQVGGEAKEQQAGSDCS